MCFPAEQPGASAVSASQQSQKMLNPLNSGEDPFLPKCLDFSAPMKRPRWNRHRSLGSSGLKPRLHDRHTEFGEIGARFRACTERRRDESKTENAGQCNEHIAQIGGGVGAKHRVRHLRKRRVGGKSRVRQLVRELGDEWPRAALEIVPRYHTTRPAPPSSSIHGAVNGTAACNEHVNRSHGGGRLPVHTK